ncbi:hypothetical protein Tco_0777773 [Tanacetum coccineum]
MDPSLCQGALGEIMANKVIVPLGGQLLPIGEADQALCFNRREGDQTREMDLKLHPELKESLIKLCNDPQKTVFVLSGFAFVYYEEERDADDTINAIDNTVNFVASFSLRLSYCNIHIILTVVRVEVEIQDGYLMMKEKEQREQELRALAQKARSKRVGLGGTVGAGTGSYVPSEKSPMDT